MSTVRRQRGFTLFELLVGMVVFMLLVSTAYAGLRTAARAWNGADERTVKIEERRVTERFLRTQLAQTFPLARSQKGQWRVWFEGAAERLVFVADLAPYIGGGGLHELILEVRGSGGERRLVLIRQPVDLERDIGEVEDEALERTLLENLRRVEFAYFGAARRRDDPEWHDEWTDLREPPRLVRVRVVPDAGEPWDDMVVRLQMNGLRFERPAPRARGANGADNADADAETDAPDLGTGTDVPLPAELELEDAPAIR